MFFQNAREAVAVFYVFFDLFCASIIGILLYTTLSDVEHTNKRLHLVNLLLAIILYCVVDSIWVLAYSNVLIPCTVTSRYLTNIIAYSVMTACTMRSVSASQWSEGVMRPRSLIPFNKRSRPFSAACNASFEKSTVPR